MQPMTSLLNHLWTVPVAVAEAHHFVVARTEGADAEPDLALLGATVPLSCINIKH